MKSPFVRRIRIAAASARSLARVLESGADRDAVSAALAAFSSSALVA
jgi:hypothetical protein